MELNSEQDRLKHVTLANLIRVGLVKIWNKVKNIVSLEQSPVAWFYYHPIFETVAQVHLNIGGK